MGYLSGLLMGGAAGWVLSQIFGGRDDDLESNEQNVNVIHFELTNHALELLLNRVDPRTETRDTEKADTNGNTDAVDTPASPSTSAPSNSPSMSDEFQNIFDEEVANSSKTTEEILDAGRKAEPVGPASFPTSTTGGYVTLDQLEKQNKRHTEVRKNGILSRGDELAIIHKFRGIVGQPYYSAVESVKENGFSLHPIYVGVGEKMPSKVQSGTVLGVRIRDPDFEGAPSQNAVVTEIIDVGGVDAMDRGRIRV